MWPILPHRRKPEQIPDEKTEYVKNPQSPSADVKTKTGGLFLFPAWLATQRKIVYNREKLTAVAGGEKSVSSTDMRQVTVELFSACQTP